MTFEYHEKLLGIIPIHKWPAKILIIEPRDDNKGHIFKTDKGRRIYDETTGESYYLIKNERLRIKGANYKQFYNDVAIFFRHSKDELVPCKVEGDKIIAIDQDMKFWWVQNYKWSRFAFDKKGFFEKYGSVIIMVLLLAIIIVITSVVFNGLTDIAKLQSEGMSALASAINSFAAQAQPAASTVPPL